MDWLGLATIVIPPVIAGLFGWLGLNKPGAKAQLANQTQKVEAALSLMRRLTAAVSNGEIDSDEVVAIHAEMMNFINAVR